MAISTDAAVEPQRQRAAGECWPGARRPPAARAACSRRWARCRWWCCGTTGRAWAIEDRCPHLGFPLHRGTVEAGLLTCHWHHARFDLASGCTLDPWADDARGFAVERRRRRRVGRAPGPTTTRSGACAPRLRDGLEQGLTLVTAKATLGLLELPGGADEVVRTALEFGLANRAAGWGSGLTVLVAMANVLPAPRPRRPRPRARARAGLRGPRHAGPPAALPDRSARPGRGAGRAPGGVVPALRRHALGGRRRAGAGDGGRRAGRRSRRRGDAARRRHRPRLPRRGPHARLHQQGRRGAGLRRRRAAPASCSRRSSTRPAGPTGPRSRRRGATRTTSPASSSGPRRCSSTRWPRSAGAAAADADVGPRGAGLGAARRRPGARSSRRCWRPPPPAPRPSSSAGPSPSPPRCASPASTCRTTTATGTRCTTPSPRPTPSTRRWPGGRRPSCCAALLHGALRVYLDRFLNVPAARLPAGEAAELVGAWTPCWDVQGEVDPAGGDRRRLPARRRRPRAGRSPPSATPCCGRTPASTGSRCTRPACASRWPGRRARRSPPSSSSAWPAGWPPTRPRCASCRPSCASPPGCGGARRCSRTSLDAPLARPALGARDRRSHRSRQLGAGTLRGDRVDRPGRGRLPHHHARPGRRRRRRRRARPGRRALPRAGHPCCRPSPSSPTRRTIPAAMLADRSATSTAWPPTPATCSASTGTTRSPATGPADGPARARRAAAGADRCREPDHRACSASRSR